MKRYIVEVEPLKRGPKGKIYAYEGQLYEIDTTKKTTKLFWKSLPFKLRKDARADIIAYKNREISANQDQLTQDTESSVFNPVQPGDRVPLLNPKGFTRPEATAPKGFGMLGRRHTPEARAAIGAAVRARHEQGAYTGVKLGRKTDEERARRAEAQTVGLARLKAAQRVGTTLIHNTGLPVKPRKAK